MSLDEDRARIHDALQQCADTADTADGVLTAWVVVAEWMTPDGERWLTRLDSDAITAWQRDGMLDHGLRGDWDPEDDPDDE